MKNMKFSKRTLVSVFVFLTMLLMLCGFAPKDNSTMVVVIKKNELCMVLLDGTAKSTTLDQDGRFAKPLISPDKKHVAYLKGSDLYVTSLESKKQLVSKSVGMKAYTWKDAKTLYYSPESGGLFTFDVISAKSAMMLQKGFRYENPVVDGKGRLFVEKYQYYNKGADMYVRDYGVYMISNGGKSIKQIIKSIPNKIDTTGDLGMYPVIADITADSRYLLYWKHPHSASTAADGVLLGAYDTLKGSEVNYGKKAPFTLVYKDNLSFNPKDAKMLALINGGNREMGKDKELMLMNVTNAAMKRLSPLGIAAMTPSYSADGKTIIYSASAEQKGTESISQWIKNGRHHIYSIDTTTKKTTQLTFAKDAFDFSPSYAKDGSILFFRSDAKENISLWQWLNAKETMLAEGLIFYNEADFPVQGYYGHFAAADFVDIK